MSQHNPSFDCAGHYRGVCCLNSEQCPLDTYLVDLVPLGASGPVIHVMCGNQTRYEARPAAMVRWELSGIMICKSQPCCLCVLVVQSCLNLGDPS